MTRNLDNVLAEILETKQRKNEAEEKRFLELVDLTFGNVDIHVARILMKTFLPQPDYGTQERVISAMLSGDRDIYIQAVLEELPRLQKEAPNWIEPLLCPEIEHHPDLLAKIIRTMPENIKAIVRQLLSDPEIVSEYPHALQIVV
jgi:hypothetical protein